MENMDSVLVLYAASSLIYWINTQIFPGLGRFHWEMAVLVFFIVTIFYSIYIPLEYRLGFERTKFITMFIIMACPFVAPLYPSKRSGYPRLYSASASGALLRYSLIFQPAGTGDICLFICLFLRACRFIIGKKIPAGILSRIALNFCGDFVFIFFVALLPLLPEKHFPTFRTRFFFLLFPDRS